MITIILFLIVVFLLFGLAFKITGLFIKSLLWLCILLPMGIMLWAIGLVFCCTILLIPVGILLFKAGARMIALV